MLGDTTTSSGFLEAAEKPRQRCMSQRPQHCQWTRSLRSHAFLIQAFKPSAIVCCTNSMPLLPPYADERCACFCWTACIMPLLLNPNVLKSGSGGRRGHHSNACPDKPA